MDIVRRAVDELSDHLAPEEQNFGWMNERLSDLAILLALNATPEAIEKWVEVVIRQVAHLPRIALCDAMDQALKTCRYTNEVVPMLVKSVEEATASKRGHLIDAIAVLEAHGEIGG